MNKSFIQRIKQCGVRALAEKFTSLHQVNSYTWMGRCPNPSHEDKHESFMVKLNSDGLESWCCYTCHKGPKDEAFYNYGSDNIAFVCWMYHNQTGGELSFKEAVKTIAKFYGIPMESDKYEFIYKANAQECRTYEAGLIPFVRSYLYDRGLDDEDIAKWHIGYDGDRVTFPIFSASGDIVGFSNREFSLASQAINRKYVNSPESPVFKKRELLYGINFASRSSSDSLFIVEGQMDAIIAHKYGMNNTVATMTCSLSDWHIEYIKRSNKSPVLCYDLDKAGVEGMEKAMARLYTAGVKNIKLVLLPDRRDIADLGRELKEGLPAFVRAHTKTYSQYILGGLADEMDMTIMSMQQTFMPRIQKALESISDPSERLVAENYIKNRIFRAWAA